MMTHHFRQREVRIHERRGPSLGLFLLNRKREFLHYLKLAVGRQVAESSGALPPISGHRRSPIMSVSAPEPLADDGE